MYVEEGRMAVKKKEELEIQKWGSVVFQAKKVILTRGRVCIGAISSASTDKWGDVQ